MRVFGKSKPLSSRPIFIGGDGRSGTTLLSLILDSHSELVVGPELHFMGPTDMGQAFLEACDMLIAGDPRSRNPELKNHPDLKKPVQFAKRCHRFGITFEDLKRLVREVRSDVGGDLQSFEDRCRLIEAIGQLRMQQTNKHRWGIKIMRDIAKVDRYAAIWPQAQFVHIIRDGRDVAASQMREHGTWGYSDITSAAESWAKLIENARRSSSGPSSYYEIRYEDIVSDLEGALKPLCDFLGVEFEAGMLDHASATHSLFENPYHHPSFKQAAQPVNDSAVGRYRQDLSAEEIDAFNAVVKQASLTEFAPPEQ
jgi:hypothetical protein